MIISCYQCSAAYFITSNDLLEYCDQCYILAKHDISIRKINQYNTFMYGLNIAFRITRKANKEYLCSASVIRKNNNFSKETIEISCNFKFFPFWICYNFALSEQWEICNTNEYANKLIIKEKKMKRNNWGDTREGIEPFEKNLKINELRPCCIKNSQNLLVPWKSIWLHYSRNDKEQLSKVIFLHYEHKSQDLIEFLR